MATHAGVFYFDGRPTAEERRWLTTSLSSAGGPAMFATDGIVMTSAGPAVWAGPAADEGLVNSESGLVLAWDGRLDNREDLCLRLYGDLGSTRTDAAIALAAFERWGGDGLAALIGDWSLSIWDSRKRLLHLGRDYMGVRPLYYHADRNAVHWSSSLAELAVRTGRADALDDRFVADFVTLRTSTDVTPYIGIRAVPPGCWLSIGTDGKETPRTYWRLSPGRISYRDPRQYEEHLRALWTEAVEVRLRAEGVVWAELSGGLDSSSIVCMADALVKGGRVRATSIRALSHVTRESREGDERRFVAEVEAKAGVRSEVLGIEEYAHLRDLQWDWVTPYATDGVEVAAHDLVRAHGGRVILSGRLGDLVMGCDPDNSAAVFDDFAQGHPLVAVAKMRAWSRARRVPIIDIAGELVADAARALRRRPFRLPATDTQILGSRLLAERLRPAIDELWAGAVATDVRLSQRGRYQLVEMTSMQAHLEPQLDPSSVVYTYPFAHRPLVEFMLGIPGEQLSRPGELRALMRRAFAGLVPDRILHRISKGYYPPAILRATRSLAQALLPVAQTGVGRRAWVDPPRVEVAVRALLDGRTDTAHEVHRVLRLEQWLVSRDRWGPTATPRGKEVKTNEVFSA